MSTVIGSKRIDKGSSPLMHAVQIVVTVMCVIYIGWQFSWGGLLSLLNNPSWTYLILCISITPLMLMVCIWRWHLLLRVRNVRVPVFYLARLYLAGCFFNQFAPSTIGGDIYRIYCVGNKTSKKDIAAASVILDRLIGLYMVLCGLLVSFLITWIKIGNWVFLLLGVCLIFIGSAVTWYLLFGNSVKLSPITRHKVSQKILSTINSWRDSIAEYRNHQGAVISTVFLAFFFLYYSV